MIQYLSNLFEKQIFLSCYTLSILMVQSSIYIIFILIFAIDQTSLSLQSNIYIYINGRLLKGCWSYYTKGKKELSCLVWSRNYPGWAWCYSWVQYFRYNLSKSKFAADDSPNFCFQHSWYYGNTLLQTQLILWGHIVSNTVDTMGTYCFQHSWYYGDTLLPTQLILW